MTSDPVFTDILDKIPERDQTALLIQLGIDDCNKLVAKKSDLQQRQLSSVCADVQLFLEVVCIYLESLDAYSSFTWAGLENFCDYTDNSGSAIVEDMADRILRKVEKVENSDPDGLTAEERKQMEQSVEDDPLTMKIRGFSSRVLQFEFDESDKKKNMEDSSDKTEVAFNGSVFYVKKCYNYQQPNGGSVVVGIRKFTKVCFPALKFVSFTSWFLTRNSFTLFFRPCNRRTKRKPSAP